MNKILTSAQAFIALFLVSTSLLANPTAPTKPASFDASVYVTKANKIRLSVEKTSLKPVTVNLRQAGKSEVLFTQQIGRKETKAALQMNVDQLPDGQYELEVKSASGSIVKQVTVGTSAPVVAPERLLVIQ